LHLQRHEENIYQICGFYVKINGCMKQYIYIYIYISFPWSFKNDLEINLLRTYGQGKNKSLIIEWMKPQKNMPDISAEYIHNF